jgi:hypothetical protein
MPKGKSLADFRAVHDKSVTIPQKIEAALVKMAKDNGPEHWEYEGQFIKLVGVSQAEFGQYRDKFKAHVVAIKSNGTTKRVWVATAKAATKFLEVEGVTAAE